ncbi:MAG: ATP-dependent transcriptional regulator, partial [Roseovarius sp.]|nr:ATP-dependent transcriptional regulator [Roseovarius sp.]
MRRGLVISLSLLIWLAGCATSPQTDLPTRAAMPEATALPPMKAFAEGRPEPPARANRDIARDFLDLAFELESGRALSR